jgi:hypothetical protein
LANKQIGRIVSPAIAGNHHTPTLRHRTLNTVNIYHPMYLLATVIAKTHVRVTSGIQFIPLLLALVDLNRSSFEGVDQ